MLELSINNHLVEEYFKAPNSIETFLEKAVNMDLMNIIQEIGDDKLHQKSLKDIQNNNLIFYQDTQDLIDTLNA
ncbi:MAG: hypothetical protein Q9M39_00510 [Sulfurovum sp.]|nr:hypothetical protein [Sulfurovum sp.]